jgi:hypothetical protein
MKNGAVLKRRCFLHNFFLCVFSLEAVCDIATETVCKALNVVEMYVHSLYLVLFRYL